MRYCRRCVLPDSRPHLHIEADGVCNACHAHSSRPAIDWEARERAFHDVVANAKTRAQPHGYDCLIPVSGGKDSTWQTVLCLEYGLRPLAVTWKTPARTALGQRNLDNLIHLGVDHIDYQISPPVERRFTLAAMERFGTPALPMHMALFNIPLAVAVRFGVPLVVWGENSAFEYGSADASHTGFRLDAAWMRTYGVMHGTTALDWVSDELDAKDLAAYFGPTGAELDEAGTLAVFLGYYFPWDVETSLKVAQAHGFQVRDEGPLTGYYNYADIDDAFIISVHHWLKWYKFGFTRLFDNLALEIRNGRMSRDEALVLIRAAGDPTPHGAIAQFCEYLGIAEARFYAIAERFRNPEIWTRRGSTWVIEDFLIEDWKWA